MENLKISDLVKFAHKYNDEDYISLEVAKLQNADRSRNTCTIYVNRLEEEQVKEPEQIPTPTKTATTAKSSKKEVSEDFPL